MDNAARHWTGAVARAAVIGAAALLAVGCGLQRAPHRGHPGRGAAHRGHPGRGAAHRAASLGRACSPASVRLWLDLRSAGVAAGTAYLPLDLTNVSRQSCVLAGPPAISVTTGPGGRQVGPAAAVAGGTAAGTLVLPAGGTAHAWLQLADAADLPAAACDPARAAGFLVTLPGRARGVFVRHPLTTCTRQVPGTDVLIIEPVRSGPARPGTAQ